MIILKKYKRRELARRGNEMTNIAQDPNVDDETIEKRFANEGLASRLLKPKPKEVKIYQPPEMPLSVFGEGMEDLYDAFIGQGNWFIPAPFIMAAGLTAAGLVAGRGYRIIVKHRINGALL